MKRDDLVAEALEWVAVGTPFHANQSVKGVGADCVGLVGGVAFACGSDLPEIPKAYSLSPDGSLKAYLDRNLTRVFGEHQPADVLLMSFDGGEPHHVAMYIGNGEIVHAYTSVGKAVKQTYTRAWKKRVVAAYRFPGIE